MYQMKITIFSCGDKPERFTANYETLDECFGLVKSYVRNADVAFGIYEDGEPILVIDTVYKDECDEDA